MPEQTSSWKKPPLQLIFKLISLFIAGTIFAFGSEVLAQLGGYSILPLIIIAFFVYVIGAYLVIRGFHWVWWFSQMLAAATILVSLGFMIMSLIAPKPWMDASFTSYALGAIVIGTVALYRNYQNEKLRTHYKIQPQEKTSELKKIFLGGLVITVTGFFLIQFIIHSSLSNYLILPA